MTALDFSLSPVDNARLNRLCGALDENLRQIETALEVSIARRGDHFSVQGETHKVELARQVLQDLYQDAQHDISLEKLQLGLIEAMRNDGDPAPPSDCLLYTSPSPRDSTSSRMPSSA